MGTSREAPDPQETTTVGDESLPSMLEAELRSVSPSIVVCLGATAAQSMIGPQFKLMQQRGQLVSCALAQQVVATIHPSSVLRARDSNARRAAYEMLVADLKVVARILGSLRL